MSSFRLAQMRFASFGLLLYLSPLLVHAENWPMWRGPRGDGRSMDVGFPKSVEGGPVWRTELPGEGPIVHSCQYRRRECEGTLLSE